MVITMLTSFGASAQEFLRVEDVTYCEERVAILRTETVSVPQITLSNGTTIVGYRSGEDFYVDQFDGNLVRIRTNIRNKPQLNVKRGDLFFHTGNYYWKESKKLQKQLEIEKIVIREINGAYGGTIRGNFGYNSFFTIVGGGGDAKGSLSGSFKGGTYTVANVTFTDGSHASILVTQDEFWLEAEPGMKVNVFTLRDTKIYELL